MAQKDLLSFCVFTDKFFEILPHHELIAFELTRLEKWEIQNLILSMPPRSGKSRIMQEFIARFFWIYKWKNILYTWHSLSLLQGFSRNIRNRINSYEYKTIFDTVISSESSAVNNWNIEWWWEFAIYWVGWGITWKGWDILVIDDPYASRQDAESDTVRRTVSDWYWSTFLSRKQSDKTKQIIIMQRWREDDLVWEILEREGEKWKELKIPSLNEKWESFWEEKFSSAFFEEIRKTSPIFFQSQYQQDPVNAWSWDFRREYFRYATISPEMYTRMNIVTFLDPAISEKEEADSSAIVTVWHDTKSNFRYLLEVKKIKALPDEIIRESFGTAKKFFSLGLSYKFWIEVIQYQKMLALAIKDEMIKQDFYFYLEEVRPSWEKNARIRSILQPLYASWMLFHNDTIDSSDIELELLKFPNGKHDDMIDAESWAMSILPSVKTDMTWKSEIFTPSEKNIYG